MGAKGTAPVRVLIADQHPVTRAGIRALLAEARSWERFETAEAGSTEEVMAMLAVSQYEIVLLECGLPGRGGVKATEVIRARWPRTKILGFSHTDDSLLFERMVGAGANGLILTTIEADTLASAIRTVIEGRQFYSNEVALRLLELNRGIASPGTSRLTKREKQVLKCIMEGVGEGEISRKLGIAKRTVDKHRQNINFKLGARTALELVQAGLRLGLVK